MTTFAQRVRSHPSAVLLASQLLAVGIYPFLDSSGAGRATLAVVSIIFLSLAIWSVQVTPAPTGIAVALGVPVVCMTIAEAIWPHAGAVVATSALLHASFYVYVTYSFLRYLFDDLVVTNDEIFAIGATFTVVAWAFAYLIVAVETVWHGSFTPWDPTTPFFDALFVSFTTLTSVGLSDILPGTGQGRALMMLEQLGGVMYLALVVSRLVGLGIQRPPKGD
jgi:hypothetical protein